AFVVRPQGAILCRDLGPTAKIDALVDRWRAGIKQRRGKDDSGAELRRRVWQPLAKDLVGIKTVLVTPDGAVTRLPFAALPGSKPGTYLIEEQAVVVVPVPQLLPALLAPPDRTKEKAGPPALLVVGDVDYGADPGAAAKEAGSRAARERAALLSKWPALPATK